MRLVSQRHARPATVPTDLQQRWRIALYRTSPLNVATDELSVIDQALSTREQQLVGLIALSNRARQRMFKPGDKSDSFCRRTLVALADDPQVLPPTQDVAGAQHDRLARDPFRRLMRIEILLQQGNETSIVLGSDACTVASRGYGSVKLLGQANGLEPLRRDLGSRFARSASTPPEKKRAA